MGGWFGSSSQTLLLFNCPCHIYILTFGVIFPMLIYNGSQSSVWGNLPLNSHTHSQWARAVMSQGNTVLRGVLFWSPEQLEAMLFEKSLQTTGGTLSFCLLHLNCQSLACDFSLTELRFNLIWCWQESKIKVFGKFRWVTKTSAFQWSVSEEHLVPIQPHPVELSAMMWWFCVFQYRGCQLYIATKSLWSS